MKEFTLERSVLSANNVTNVLGKKGILNVISEFTRMKNTFVGFAKRI